MSSLQGPLLPRWGYGPLPPLRPVRVSAWSASRRKLTACIRPQRLALPEAAQRQRAAGKTLRGQGARAKSGGVGRARGDATGAQGKVGVLGSRDSCRAGRVRAGGSGETSRVYKGAITDEKEPRPQHLPCVWDRIPSKSHILGVEKAILLKCLPRS